MTNNKNAIDMKTNFLSQIRNFRWLPVVTLGILVTSCGSYQNSSYYDNDGVYGSTGTTRVNAPQQDNSNSEYYRNYFSSLNEESQELITNVENYTTPQDSTQTTAARTASSNYNGWGNNATNVTVNYYDSWNDGWGWNGGWGGWGLGWNAGWGGWGWNNWGWNGGWGLGWNAGWGWGGWGGWGWNNWYGPGWGWGWNSWYGPGWGWGGGWNNHFAYNGGRRNTIYRNPTALNGRNSGIGRTNNGFTRSNNFTRGNTVRNGRADYTNGVRPVNITRGNSGVRQNYSTNNTRPNSAPNTGNVRNNTTPNSTPTRSESNTRSYTPSRSNYGGGGSYGGGGGFGGGGRSGGGGGGRR
jgi:hypothetical protein